MTEKEKRILRHVQTMSVLTTCMQVEYMQDIVDARFKDPNMNNHIRRIKESLEQIRKGLSFKYKVIDRDFMENEHGLVMHRLFTYFSTMETSQLDSIITAYEAYDKETPPILLP